MLLCQVRVRRSTPEQPWPLGLHKMVCLQPQKDVHNKTWGSDQVNLILVLVITAFQLLGVLGICIGMRCQFSHGLCFKNLSSVRLLEATLQALLRCHDSSE